MGTGGIGGLALNQPNEYNKIQRQISNDILQGGGTDS